MPSVSVDQGDTLSNYNQPPWPPQPKRGPYPPPAPGYPRQPANPWGQPPPQYGQPSASPPTSTPKKSGSTGKILLIVGAIVAVLFVVVVVAVLLIGGSKDNKKIAVADVQTQVQQVLLDRVTGYSSGDIKDVKCNDGEDPKVKKGGSFTCDVTVRGKPHKLTVTFQDADGTYEVGLPQLEGGK